MSLLQGTNPFPSGLVAQRQHSSSCCFQEELGGFFSSGSHQVSTTRRAGQGEVGNEHVEKLSSPKQEPEVPHGVCSALREPGQSRGGEVNIVRRGRASPAPSLPTGGGPASSAPAGCRGPAGTWDNSPGKSSRSWAGGQGWQSRLQIVPSPAWLCSLLAPHPTGDQHRDQPPPSWEPPCTCPVLGTELSLQLCPIAEQVFIHPSPFPCP